MNILLNPHINSYTYIYTFIHAWHNSHALTDKWNLCIIHSDTQYTYASWQIQKNIHNVVNLAFDKEGCNTMRLRSSLGKTKSGSRTCPRSYFITLPQHVDLSTFLVSRFAIVCGKQQRFIHRMKGKRWKWSRGYV